MQGTLVAGFVKDVRVIAGVHNDGYKDADGRQFVCRANAAGDLQYKTETGSVITVTLAAGDLVAFGDIPILVQEILAAGTDIENVTIGYIWT